MSYGLFFHSLAVNPRPFALHHRPILVHEELLGIAHHIVLRSHERPEQRW